MIKDIERIIMDYETNTLIMNLQELETCWYDLNKFQPETQAFNECLSDIETRINIIKELFEDKVNLLST